MKLILNMSIILVLSSCAAWRLQKTEVINVYAPELKEIDKKIKTRVSIENLTYFLNGEKLSEKASAEKINSALETIKRAYKEAQIFELSEEEKTDLEIKLSIEVHGKSDITMTVLTAMTLFLFPSKTTDEFSIKAQFIKNGEELGVIEKVETVTMYRQLFLIFAMPFKSPLNINQETLVDLNRSIVTEAFDEGYLKI